ncbi:hypothetical protein T484DRAFT_1897308 [Baffinella frigidus]|nr:hypothetical protein T484DRAFT_1897308 [Cryptophyta sp. CCMP2293]
MSWMDTLFVWCGKVEELGDGRVSWRGTWVGVDSADAKKAEAPNSGDFAASKAHFEVEAQGGSEVVLSFFGGKGWELDQGDGEGMQLYHDTVHNVSLSQSEQSAQAHTFSSAPSVVTWLLPVAKPGAQTAARASQPALVVASGHNDFAKFISLGWTRTESSSQTRTLTIARRYLDDKDVRCGWTLDDLAREAGGGSGWDHAGAPPWQCDAMGARLQRAGKGKREAAAANLPEAPGSGKRKRR